jgi:hypothetical protein
MRRANMVNAHAPLLNNTLGAAPINRDWRPAQLAGRELPPSEIACCKGLPGSGRAV